VLGARLTVNFAGTCLNVCEEFTKVKQSSFAFASTSEQNEDHHCHVGNICRHLLHECGLYLSKYVRWQALWGEAASDELGVQVGPHLPVRREVWFGSARVRPLQNWMRLYRLFARRMPTISGPQKLCNI